MSASAIEVLRRYWGFSDFRDHQLDIIQSVLVGKDTIAILPTGGGKSICFQVPALCIEGICLVISPLIALMNDQVHTLRDKNIGAASIDANTIGEELQSIWNKCEMGYIKFLYVSPERLQNERFIDHISNLPIGLVAIDEAHCISQWGFDFRPSYLRIHLLRAKISACPIIALTATATTPVISDIQQYLDLREPMLFQGKLIRKNLQFSVVEAENLYADLSTIIAPYIAQQQSIIIYTYTRRQAENVCLFLHQQRIMASFYHAGMPTNERKKVEDAFLKDHCKIIVATSAFGMGIDKPNVRAVIHLALCDAIESYYQQAGRAGRDGQEADCILLHLPSKVEKIQQSIEKKFPPIHLIQKIYQRLYHYARHHWIDLQERECKMDLIVFSRQCELDPATCFGVLQYLKHQNLIELHEERRIAPQFGFLVDKAILDQHALLHQEHQSLIDTLLRQYPEVLSRSVGLRISAIADHLGKEKGEIHEYLRAMQQQGIGLYLPAFDGMSVFLLQDSMDISAIKEDLYLRLKENEVNRKMSMWHYAHRLKSPTCRQQFFAEYFDAPCDEACGTCDNCRRAHTTPIHPQDIYKEILRHVREQESISIHALRGFLRQRYDQPVYTQALHDLVNEEQLFIHPQSLMVSVK